VVTSWERSTDGPHSSRCLCRHVRPTTGDRVRLADTDLIVEVERDLTTYGEEVKFGGGKVIVMAWVNRRRRRPKARSIR